MYRPSGTLANHQLNHTTFSRYAIASKKTYDEIPTIENHTYKNININNEYNVYKYLNPGIYKIIIDDQEYAITLHDKLIDTDKLIIKNQYDIFAIHNLEYVNIIPYKLYHGLEVGQYGHILNHTLNDNIDTIYCCGKTKIINDNEKSWDNPSKFIHLNKLNIKTRSRTKNIIKDIELDLKTNLKSIGKNIHDRSIYESDKIYLNSYKRRCTYEYKITDLKLTGYENLIEYDKDKSYTILKLVNSNIKPNSFIECSHLNNCYYFNMNSIDNNCISSSPSDMQNGIFIKLRNNIYNTLSEFKSKLNNMYNDNNSLNILFINKNSIFQEILLDNYTIPLFYKGTDIIVIPFNETEIINNIYNDDLALSEVNIEIDPNTYWNNLYTSADINLRNMYFYKYLNI